MRRILAVCAGLVLLTSSAAAPAALASPSQPSPCSVDNSGQSPAATGDQVENTYPAVEY